MQPTIIEDTVTIAANTVNANVIVSNPGFRGLLNAPYPSRIRFIATISAVGLVVDALHGNQMYVSNAAPRIASSMEEPQDVINDDAYCQAQEQMVIKVSNLTAGALDIKYRLEMIPVVDESWDGGPVELPPDTVVMQNLAVVTTVTTDQQLLDGLAFEQLQVPSILTVFMTQSAIGLLRQLFIDQDRICPPSTMNTTNRIPQDPFDITIRGVEVPANNKQYLSVTNPTGGSLTVRWKTKNKKLMRD